MEDAPYFVYCLKCCLPQDQEYKLAEVLQTILTNQDPDDNEFDAWVPYIMRKDIQGLARFIIKSAEENK